MSTYVEFRDRRDPGPSFLRPIDATSGGGHWRPPPSRSVSYGPRASSHTNSRVGPLSPYSYTTRLQPPPVDPIYGIPDPAPVARGAAEGDDFEADAEYIEPMEVPQVEPYMEFDAARSRVFDEDPEVGARQEGRGGKRFVGGFVANLKKLPRAMARNLLYDRRHPHPQLEQYTYATDLPAPRSQERKPTKEAAPPYDAPGSTVQGGVRYIQGMQMPEGHVIPSLHLPTPSHSAHSLSRAPSHLSPRHTPSPHHHKDPSLHSGISPPRIVRNPDPEPESPSTEGSPTVEQAFPNPYPTEPGPSNLPAGSVQPPPPAVTFPATAPLQPHRRHTVTIQSPDYHEPPLATDYQRMASPIRPPPEPPLETQLARVAKFFHDINNLPWFSSTIAADFIPAESGRARHARSQSAGSWYSSKHRDIDLLAGGPSTHALAGASGQSLPQARGHASSATLAYGQGSQLSIDAHFQQPMSAPVHGQYSYPVPPLNPPPQLYMYQAAVQPVITTPRGTPEQGPQDIQQAYPVYMLSAHSPYMRPPNASQQHTPLQPATHPATAAV